MPFSSKSNDEKEEPFLRRLAVQSRLAKVPEGQPANSASKEIRDAVETDEIKLDQFKKLVAGLKQGKYDSTFSSVDLTGDKDISEQIQSLIEKIEASIKGLKSKRKESFFQGKVDDLLEGDHSGMLDHLRKLKKDRYISRTKQRNPDEFDRIMEYAKGKPELMSELQSISPTIFGFVEMVLNPPDNLSVLEYFRKISQANLALNEKKYAIAPKNSDTKEVVSLTNFTGKSTFTVTPSFEYFLRQNSLNVDKIPTKRPKTSFQLDRVLVDLVSGSDGALDKYDVTRYRRDGEYNLKGKLKEISDELSVMGSKAAEKAKPWTLKEKLDGLKKLRDDADNKKAIEEAMKLSTVIDVSKFPKEDVFVIAFPKEEEYNRKSEKFNNFAEKYFDGNKNKAFQFVRRNTEALEKIRDRAEKYRGSEIVIPNNIKYVFEDLMTEEAFDDPKISLESQDYTEIKSEMLNDGRFSDTNNVADYLETIASLQYAYPKKKKKTLAVANIEYMDGELEYEKLIELYEKEFSDVKDKFIQGIGERVAEISKLETELVEKIRPIIAEVFSDGMGG